MRFYMQNVHVIGAFANKCRDIGYNVRVTALARGYRLDLYRVWAPVKY